MEDDLPAALFVDAALAGTRGHLVADDLHLDVVGADEVLEESLDDGLHTGREDDNRDVVLQGPFEELVEVRVKLDILHEVFDALVVGLRDAVHHLAERVSERLGAIESVHVALTPESMAEANVVGLPGS